MNSLGRPLTVYLSSTPKDLQKHCNAVTQKLLQEGYQSVGMKEDDSKAIQSLGYRLEQVRNCDVFVGIIAHSYGDAAGFEEVANVPQLPGTVPGVTSVAEYEYRQALAANKRILMFLHDEAAKWPLQDMDSHTNTGNKDKLCAWREEIRREQRFLFFAGRHDLANKALTVIAQGLEGKLSSVNKLVIPVRDNIPPLTYSKLVGRQTQLNRIQEALNKNLPLVYLEGNDGVGKTSVAIAAGNAYLNQSSDNQKERYVVWVDASAGAGKNLTLDSVLNLIARVASYQSLAQANLTEKSKKQRIQDILNEQKFLFIADDFDRIENEELKQWLLGITFPSHLLLIVRKAPQQKAPSECITLDELNEEEAIEYINNQALALKISELEKDSVTPNAIRELANYAKGNPRVIELATGKLSGLLRVGVEFSAALKRTTQPDRQHHLEGEQSIHKIETLHRKVWEDLSLDARTVLRSIPLFSGSTLISRDALLATCGLKKPDFNAAQGQLGEPGLLRLDEKTGKYIVDPDTRKFAQEELRKEPEFEVAARKRWSEFYRDFVRRHVVRAEPEVLYWRSLVSNSIESLDSEWPAILDVLYWADQHRKDQLLLTLVMLLIHYMDSRFLNQERVLFAGKGVQAARRLRLPYEQALLHIDALGWTYFEEDCPHKAYEEISIGLGLVKPLGAASQDAWELKQLGFAWQARVKMEIALADRARFESPILHEESVHLIEKALCADCSPWIRYRIFKAAGDIAFKAEIPLRQSGRNEEALTFYLQAEAEVAKYGGEGGSYQIAPRIGLAYLRRNGKDDFKRARSYFDQLCEGQNQHVPIVGELYGKYGKALIERHLGEKTLAEKELKNLESELRRHTSSNQLLKLVTSFVAKTPS
jgi:hypothetical protein